MRLLSTENQIKSFIKAIQTCTGPVYLTDWQLNSDGEPNLKINLKSTLSLYVGIADLISKNGDWYEIHCYNKKDEAILMEFFDELNKDKLKVHEYEGEGTKVN